MPLHRLRCALLVGVLCGRTAAGLAQAPPDAAARDSVLQCAVRRAESAGFHLLASQRPGRLGLMRSIQTPGPRQPVDGMRLAIAPGDSTGTVTLEVRVTTFLVARSGFSSTEVAPRPSLMALADSLRANCRRARTQPRESP